MWRRTLKPIIYGRAIIECAEDYEIIDEEEIPPVEEEDGDSFKWHSNIEFLRRVGNPGGVHTLTVYHDASSGIYKLLQYFEKQVVANFALFCNTRALNMYFLFGEEPDPDDVDTEVCRGEPLKVDRMVGAFAKIFTQVQRLEIVDTDNLYNPTLLSKLCNAIVRACSQSLVVCLVDPPLDLGRLRFSHRLWTLSTELKECSTDVQPQVDVANMKHMKLSNMPVSFDNLENVAKPLNTNIQNLMLSDTCFTDLPVRFAADTALYLIARIVTLNLLLIYEELMVPLRNAIEQEQLPHPHIRKIIEKLGGDM
ncbi:hypothetical protein GGF46_003667 [Coemansia sp. RSA 552]|nr:hypothetical protein GGF46_003667 [Coemansia sp. RSA 552]